MTRRSGLHCWPLFLPYHHDVSSLDCRSPPTVDGARQKGIDIGADHRHDVRLSFGSLGVGPDVAWGAPATDIR
jgi:hypothetical protein